MATKYPITLHNKFTICNNRDLFGGRSSPITALPDRQDRIYVASFIKRSEVCEPGVLSAEIEFLRQRSSQYSDSLPDDAVVNAIAASINIGFITKKPSDWLVMLLTIQYRSIEDVETVVVPRSFVPEIGIPHVIGFELSPIVDLSLGINPYSTGAFLRSLRFDSRNI